MYRLFLEGWVPEGYEVVEKPEHKKQRLEAEEKLLKKQIDWHSRRGAEVAEDLEEIKKELKKFAV